MGLVQTHGLSGSTEGWTDWEGCEAPTEETYEDNTAPANKEARMSLPQPQGTEIGPSLSKQQEDHQNHQGRAQ